MNNNGFALKMNRDGELVQENLHDFILGKYKADNLFFWGPIPASLMIGCIGIDIAFFANLFSRISYDSQLMILLQVAGLAFAADVVAAYAGILAKRIKQGLNKEKWNLILLLAVPILALIINGVLRVATLPLMSPDGNVNPETIALTIISIVVPVFTSVGNFAISYETYDPLGKRMCREEMTIAEVKDHCRRLEAILDECRSFDSEIILKMDRNYLANAKKALLNDALKLDADVQVKLMEHLGDPASTNVLSKARCNVIFDRLDYEIKALESACGIEKDLLAVNVTESNHVTSFLEVA